MALTEMITREHAESLRRDGAVRVHVPNATELNLAPELTFRLDYELVASYCEVDAVDSGVNRKTAVDRLLSAMLDTVEYLPTEIAMRAVRLMGAYRNIQAVTGTQAQDGWARALDVSARQVQGALREPATD